MLSDTQYDAPHQSSLSLSHSSHSTDLFSMRGVMRQNKIASLKIKLRLSNPLANLSFVYYIVSIIQYAYTRKCVPAIN